MAVGSGPSSRAVHFLRALGAALPRPRSEVLLGLAAVTALLHITSLSGVLAVRLVYPGEIEWMEDGSLYHAYRLLRGQPLYPEPGIGFMPYPYPPFHWAVLAGFGAVFGLSYTLGRALSLGSVLVVCTVLGAAVFRKYKTQAYPAFWVILMLGMVAAGFSVTGGWYDVVRADSLALGLLVATGALVWRLVVSPGQHERALAFASVTLACAAIFTKQTNGLPVVWMTLYLWVCRRRTGWRVGLSVLGVVLGVFGALEAATSGHFSHYTLASLSRHPVTVERFSVACQTAADFAPYLAWLPIGVLVLALHRSLSQEAVFWFGTLLTTVPTAVLSYAKAGGFDNAFMPLALLGGPVALLVFGDALNLLTGKPTRVWALLVAAAVAVYLGGRSWDYQAACPTREQFENAAFLRDFARDLGPRVLAPHHPFLAVQSGSVIEQFHGMSWTDARWARVSPLSLAGFLERERPDFVLSTLDEDPAVRCAFDRYFRLDVLQRPPESPPLTGHPTRIRTVLKRRPDRPNPRVVFDFESGTYSGWQVRGAAFGERPARVDRIEPRPLLCAQGTYAASSAHSERGDEAQGELGSPVFTLDRDRLSVLVAGGGSARVELRVGHETIQSAAGGLSESLREVVWDLRHVRGQPARLFGVDDDGAAWGHIVFDYVVLFDGSG